MFHESHPKNGASPTTIKMPRQPWLWVSGHRDTSLTTAGGLKNRRGHHKIPPPFFGWDNKIAPPFWGGGASQNLVNGCITKFTFWGVRFFAPSAPLLGWDQVMVKIAPWVSQLGIHYLSMIHLPPTWQWSKYHHNISSKVPCKLNFLGKTSL